jgi:predicted short-subunit dehydrogenase-like oxidoreductase (DUF2520 family)
MPARIGFRMPSDGVLFIAVPDAAIRDMAARLDRENAPAALSVVHLSGATRLEALDVLRPRAIGSFHPLQSFPFPRPPEAFAGITVAVDASSPALERRLNAMARRLGAHPRHVGDEQRAAYHAAGVFASNFVNVVLREAVRLLVSIGWSEEDAERALLPLTQGAMENIARRGLVKALTGPIRRGDAETVRRHLDVVGDPDLYRMLASIALQIAREAGLEPAAAEGVERALTRDVAATRRRRRR